MKITPIESKMNTQLMAELKIWIDPLELGLREKYEEHVQKHNTDILAEKFPNSGFDIFVPSDTLVPYESLLSSFFLDFKIKTEMTYHEMPSAFYVYPRSSFSKTPLILSNHVGIIDSGYRGNLKGALRNLEATTSYSGGYRLEKHSRILQICHPSLCPIYVRIVDSESELSTTSRGEGGFGSTGK